MTRSTMDGLAGATFSMMADLAGVELPRPDMTPHDMTIAEIEAFRVTAGQWLDWYLNALGEQAARLVAAQQGTPTSRDICAQIVLDEIAFRRAEDGAQLEPEGDA